MDTARAVNLFAALSEPTRLRILRTLLAAKGKELCNCELVDALEEPQSNVSRHLRVLTEAGVVRERRDGRWVYFGLAADDPAVAAVGALVGTLEDTSARDDARRLRERLTLRDNGRCILGVQKTHLLSALPSPQKARRRKEARR